MSCTPTVDDVREAQRRNHEAFRRLYVATADGAHRTARWMLGTDDVDDVIQDIYLRVWERLPGLKEPPAFDTWFRRLAVNVILRRREQRARRDPWTPLDQLKVGAAPTVRPAPVGLRRDLERAVAQLPEGARTVFVLFDVEGYRHQEIGRLLGISEHTSRSQLHRARSLLKQVLQDAEGW